MNALIHICNTAAMHYAVRIFIGIVLIELILSREEAINLLWAIMSLIVVIEPQIKKAWSVFKARFINTLLGSLVGLFFIFTFGLHAELLPVAVFLTALISAYFTNMQQGWRIGPVTAALIMSASLTATSTHDAYELALHRTIAVLLGSIIALVVTEIMSFFWVPPDSEKKL